LLTKSLEQTILERSGRALWDQHDNW